MSDPVVSIDEFSLYLNNAAIIGDARAAFILNQAQVLCETIIYPLPLDPDGINSFGSKGVVLDVAQRAYANPTEVNGTVSLYSEGVGPFSEDRPGSSGNGLWLTKNNEATLRRLAGGGGAFSTSSLPADYCVRLPWWDENRTVPI